jgi:hypothetical protein
LWQRGANVRGDEEIKGKRKKTNLESYFGLLSYKNFVD